MLGSSKNFFYADFTMVFLPWENYLHSTALRPSIKNMFFLNIMIYRKNYKLYKYQLSLSHVY